MIWFACKKCGKRHGRPDGQAGTLVFCECSYGNRVPWASTVAEPEPDANPAPIPLPPSRPYPERRDDPRPLTRRQPRREDPRYCLNHDDTAAEHSCADCKSAFCAGCLLTFQGRTLCGPCKNFRIRAMNRPAHVSGLAITALVVGLVSGPVVFCLNTFSLLSQGTNPSLATAIALGFVGLVVPVGGLVLAWLALREMDTKPATGGRMLALTGAACGVVGTLWTLAVGGMLVFKQLSG